MRVSDVPSRPSSPGRRKLHCHCWPMTSTSDAPSGTVTNWFHTNKPGANMAATPTAVTIVTPDAHRSLW